MCNSFVCQINRLYMCVKKTGWHTALNYIRAQIKKSLGTYVRRGNWKFIRVKDFLLLLFPQVFSHFLHLNMNKSLVLSLDEELVSKRGNNTNPCP